MKKVSLLLSTLFVTGMLLAQNGTAQESTPKNIEPLVTITASTTDAELEAIQSKIKEGYEVDVTYTAQRDSQNQITSLLLHLSGAETNTNLSLSGDQPIADLYIIEKPNKKLGIWSERTEERILKQKKRFQERRTEMEAARLERKEAMMESKQARKEAQEARKTAMKARSQVTKSKLKENQSAVRLNSSSNVDPLYVINGIRQDKDALETIDKTQIDHINVLKGNKALEKYGEDGKNGVIEIQMKAYTIQTATSLTKTIEINSQTTDAEIATIVQNLESDGATLKIKKVKRNASGKIIGYDLKFDDGNGSQINTSKRGTSQEITPLIITYDQDGKISLKQ